MDDLHLQHRLSRYLWGINGWLPGYLIKGKGIHLEHAGWLSSMPFIAMLLGEIIGAWLSDRVDRRAAACFISLAGAGIGLAAVMHFTTPLPVIAAMSFSTFMWGTGAPNIFALLAKATIHGSAPRRVEFSTGWETLPGRYRRR